jgi:hypothetical protein
VGLGAAGEPRAGHGRAAGRPDDARMTVSRSPEASVSKTETNCRRRSRSRPWRRINWCPRGDTLHTHTPTAANVRPPPLTGTFLGAQTGHDGSGEWLQVRSWRGTAWSCPPDRRRLRRPGR